MKRFKCPICEKIFARKSNLNRHIYTHTQEKFYNCERCKMSFGDSSTLQRHINSHSGSKSYGCLQCPKSYSTNYLLRKHISHSHFGQQREKFICNICRRSFNDKSNLSRHLMIHTGEKLHRCNCCEKEFYHRADLQRHISTHHTNEKPYGCPLCSLRFRTTSNRKSHMNYVHGVKEMSHECLFCGKKFVIFNDLQKHMRAHTREKPYFCNGCDAEFSQAKSRNQHVCSYLRKLKIEGVAA